MRKLAYEIKQRNEADYRFFRFQGEPQLLERLDHNLKITDGVLRFRIFKVDPDAPANPPPAIERPMAIGAVPARTASDRPRRGRRDGPRRVSVVSQFPGFLPPRGANPPCCDLRSMFGIERKRS